MTGVPGGRPHAGVRRAIVLADVRLDLDDPADPRSTARPSLRPPSRTRRAPMSARAASSVSPASSVARERRPAVRAVAACVHREEAVRPPARGHSAP